MTVTAFGGLFIPLTLFGFLFLRSWLLPLACVAAVLHSPSVIDVRVGESTLGITPFFITASLILLDVVLRFRQRGALSLGIGPSGLSVRLWLAFAALSLLSALVLPWLFSGELAYTPLDKNGTESAPVALTWSLSNLAQIVNLGLILGVLMWILQHPDDPELPKRMLLGVIAAVGVSVVIGLQQRLAWNGLLPLWEDFWASNPTYAQNYRTWAGPVPRVSWPFVEASYASAWYAAVTGGFIAMFLADVHRHKSLFGAMIGAFALANTLGATGLLAIVAFGSLTLVGACFVAIFVPGLRGGLIYRISLGMLVCTCSALACFLVLRHYDLQEMAGQALSDMLRGQGPVVLGEIRPRVDALSLGLVRDTFGLGVGMGSNRGSSFLTTLASNVGVLGFALFVAALGYQFKLLAERIRHRPDSPTLFFLGSGVAGLFAVAIAIPDQNWPALWVLILGGVACLRDAESSSGTAESPQHARH